MLFWSPLTFTGPKKKKKISSIQSFNLCKLQCKKKKSAINSETSFIFTVHLVLFFGFFLKRVTLIVDFRCNHVVTKLKYSLLNSLGGKKFSLQGDEASKSFLKHYLSLLFHPSLSLFSLQLWSLLQR